MVPEEPRGSSFTAASPTAAQQHAQSLQAAYLQVADVVSTCETDHSKKVVVQGRAFARIGYWVSHVVTQCRAVDGLRAPLIQRQD